MMQTATVLLTVLSASSIAAAAGEFLKLVHDKPATEQWILVLGAS